MADISSKLPHRIRIETFTETQNQDTGHIIKNWTEFVTRRRIEQATGGISALMASLKGIKDVDPYSFMPHEKQPKKAELSLEEYMAQTYGE